MLLETGGAWLESDEDFDLQGILFDIFLKYLNLEFRIEINCYIDLINYGRYPNLKCAERRAEEKAFFEMLSEMVDVWQQLPEEIHWKPLKNSNLFEIKNLSRSRGNWRPRIRSFNI